ncbi:hypothetical protein PG996_007829 [Apiospora saccharicola]|uniref:Uncharacterized protein n=1 Tax=Apiospora saccharicola TaxID=335842 RepID=A0ABR1UW92_9PEZI
MIPFSFVLTARDVAEAMISGGALSADVKVGTALDRGRFLTAAGQAALPADVELASALGAAAGVMAGTLVALGASAGVAIVPSTSAAVAGVAAGAAGLAVLGVIVEAGGAGRVRGRGGGLQGFESAALMVAVGGAMVAVAVGVALLVAAEGVANGLPIVNSK